MNIARRPIIVVLGMITSFPVGGVIWQTMHYLVGLQRLGFDVRYVEDHGILPQMFATNEDPLGHAKAARFLETTMERFGFGGCWSYHPWDEKERIYGLQSSAVRNAFGAAVAVLNLSGATLPRPDHRVGGALLYLETDPVAPEIELHDGVRATAEFLDAHTAHFTFGENLGAPDCKVPLPPARYTFRPTRQPVVLDLWESHAVDPADCFTTIANWKQPEREMTLHGEVYRWSKHHEFLRFLDLPRHTGECFELALSSFAAEDRAMLTAHGWRVRPALDFTRDVDAYRSYIWQSRGEWTVAKDQNVRLRSGWFSDRAATYLASGRPVVTQETGFGNVLPTGQGLFTFSTLEEAVAAVAAIRSDYGRHSRAASEIAREYFSYDVVLPKMLSEAGLSLPSRT